MNSIFEVEYKIEAKHSITCDACNSTLGEDYLNHKGALSIRLPDGKDEQGYDKSKDFHFCGEGCLRACLNKRVQDESKASLVKCQACNKSFDYSKQSETSMGAVKCPNCGITINQNGENLHN